VPTCASCGRARGDAASCRRADEAGDAQTEALSLYERKGNVVMAGRARELLT